MSSGESTNVLANANHRNSSGYALPNVNFNIGEGETEDELFVKHLHQRRGIKSLYGSINCSAYKNKIKSFIISGTKISYANYAYIVFASVV